MINTAVIFAGGKGTRFLEQTRFLPKPMILAKGVPLLVHVINHYVKYGVSQLVVLSGFKQEEFSKYFKNQSSYTYDQFLETFKREDGIEIKLLDTGEDTLTGGRLKILLEKIELDNFYLTYGDGISDVDIDLLTKFHFESNKLVTVTAVNPPPRFGDLEIEGNLVTEMREKHESRPSWINGGYFVVSGSISDFLTKDEPFEQAPLRTIAEKKELAAYKHNGYWQCVDTIRELEILENDLDEKRI